MVAAKWRRSWNRTHLRPALLRAASQMTQKLLGRSRSPVAPLKRGASLSGPTKRLRWSSSDRHDRARHEDLAGVPVLGRAEVERAIVELVQCPLDPDGAGHEVDIPALEAEDLAPAERPPGGDDDCGPILLGHRIGEGGHLIDVGNSPFDDPVGAATLDPARILQDQVVGNGGIEDCLEDPVGGASDTGSLRRQFGVPTSHHDRRDLHQLLVTEGGNEAVGDEPAVVLLGASPDVGALGKPQRGVVTEGDPPEFRVDPVASVDGCRHGVQESIGVRLRLECLGCDVPASLVPVAGLVPATREFV